MSGVAMYSVECEYAACQAAKLYQLYSIAEFVRNLYLFEEESGRARKRVGRRINRTECLYSHSNSVERRTPGKFIFLKPSQAVLKLKLKSQAEP